MEENPELEFEYFLAQKIGMTVARMRSEMSNVEFLGWSRFYSRKAQRDELEAAKAG